MLETQDFAHFLLISFAKDTTLLRQICTNFCFFYSLTFAKKRYCFDGMWKT